tara:strand:- start:365 stop:2266 length:1902 start_codon:yes stop_codon:yes gene_type:complete
MCWNSLQLGNNGVNTITAGKTSTGGYLDIYTNTTNDMLAQGTHNGCHTARFCNNGYSAFYDWIQVAPSKGIYGATNNGHFYLNAVSDYGTWAVTGARNGWNGIYMCGMTIMAKADCSEHGFYNDIDNEWMINAFRNGEVQLRYNGVVKLKTLSGGTCSCGCLISEVVCGSSYMNSGKFCSSSSFFCSNCLCMAGTIKSTNCICAAQHMCASHFYGDGSNLTGISAGGAGTTDSIRTHFGCDAGSGICYNASCADNAAGSGLNVVIGKGAVDIGSANCTFRSVIIGHETACCTCNSSRSVLIGFRVLACGARQSSTAYHQCTSSNVIIGYCSFFRLGCSNSNVNNQYNTSVGSESNLTTSRGCRNAYFGAMAGSSQQCARDNTGLGSSAMAGSYLGSGYSCCNTAVGGNAMQQMSGGCANTSLGYGSGRGNSSGCHNVFIGQCAGSSYMSGSYTGIRTGYSNIIIGSLAHRCGTDVCNAIVIGYCTQSCGSNTTVIGSASTTNTYICGHLSKYSGSFQIPHPDPAKSEKMDLMHSFVESPNEGDNIYRYSVETEGCSKIIELPDYYRFLNKDDQVWISPVRHFGSAYGEVTKDQKCIVICSCQDGCYNVLLIGTRKDRAVRRWSGPEVFVNRES